MDGLVKIVAFLNILEEDKMHYELGKIRDGILITITVPGERWEVEFLVDGSVEIERFKSNGLIEDEKELYVLAEQYFENQKFIEDINNFVKSI